MIKQKPTDEAARPKIENVIQNVELWRMDGCIVMSYKSSEVWIIDSYLTFAFSILTPPLPIPPKRSRHISLSYHSTCQPTYLPAVCLSPLSPSSLSLSKPLFRRAKLKQPNNPTNHQNPSICTIQSNSMYHTFPPSLSIPPAKSKVHNFFFFHLTACLAS